VKQQPPRTLTTAQVAATLNTSPAEVRKLKAAKRITPIGGTPRYPLYSPTDIAKYIRETRAEKLDRPPTAERLDH